MEKDKAMKYVMTSTVGKDISMSTGKEKKGEKVKQQKVENVRVEGKSRRAPILSPGERWGFIWEYITDVEEAAGKVEDVVVETGAKWEDEKVFAAVEGLEKKVRALHMEVAILFAQVRMLARKNKERR